MTKPNTTHPTLGTRIKDRLAELKRDVKWLHRQTGIPVSTLYEIMNGRMQSSTRLPLIAAKLGLNALWLLTETGPKLAGQTRGDPSYDAMTAWPFSFERARIDQLSSRDLAMLTNTIVALLDSFDQMNSPTAAITKAAKKAQR